MSSLPHGLEDILQTTIIITTITPTTMATAITTDKAIRMAIPIANDMFNLLTHSMRDMGIVRDITLAMSIVKVNVMKDICRATRMVIRMAILPANKIIKASIK